MSRISFASLENQVKSGRGAAHSYVHGVVSDAMKSTIHDIFPKGDSEEDIYKNVADLVR